MKRLFCDRCGLELLKRDFSLGKFEFCKGCAVSFENWLKDVGVPLANTIAKNRDFLGELDTFLGVKKK